MSEIIYIEVSEDQDGQRLDRWLKKQVPHIPYGLLQKLIRKGQLRVDGKRAKTDMRLSMGQSVRIPPVEAKKQEKQEYRISEQERAFIKSLVIYDDGEIMALNKPAGIAVQGGSKTRKHIDGMLGALTDKKGVKPRLAHRLDKDTSGVLLLARTAQMTKALGFLFKKRQIKKIYWALLAGVPDPREGIIKAPLIKASGAQKEKMMIDDEEGKSAITEYFVVDQALGHASFTAFWPHTGRTHQIRAHAALLDCPIIGDRKYGGDQAFIEGTSHARGLHLHAGRLIFRHPHTKKMIDLQAEMSGEMKKSWKSLGFEPTLKEDPFEG